MTKVSFFFSLLFAIVSAGFADASIITYSTRSAFDSAVSGQTMIDFEAQNTGGGVDFYGNSLTVGSVSFTHAGEALFVLGKDTYSTTGLSSSYLNNNGGGSQSSRPGSQGGPLVVNFTGGGIYSLGMDVGQLFNNYSGTSDNMTILLSSGDQVNLTGLQAIGFTNGTMPFVGFTSSTAITSIAFDDPSFYTMIDNFAFSTQPLTAVPEPSSFVVGIGLATFVLLLRRRKSGLHSQRTDGLD